MTCAKDHKGTPNTTACFKKATVIQTAGVQKDSNSDIIRNTQSSVGFTITGGAGISGQMGPHKGY